MNKIFYALMILISAIALSSCATTQRVKLGQTGLSVDDTREVMELNEDAAKLEKMFWRRGMHYENPDFEAYLNELGNLVVPDEAKTEGPFTFRLLRDPTVNAFALPNRKIYLHTGLVAAVRTRDELAAVLAHEVSHVINRDALYAAKSLRKKTVAYKIVDLFVSPASYGVGLADLGELMTNVIYRSAVQGYSREQEERADKEALKRIIALGFNPYAPVNTINAVMKDDDIYGAYEGPYFLCSHPSNKSRKERFVEWLTTEHGLSADRPRNPREDRAYLEISDSVRLDDAWYNVRWDRFDHAIRELEDLKERHPENPRVYFLLGEAYRRLSDNPHKIEAELDKDEFKKRGLDKDENLKAKALEWRETARENYEKAVCIDESYANAHKGLAKCFKAEGNKEEAVKEFEKYLELAPEVKDRRSILREIEDLNKKEEEKDE